jgi:hypothetical protein
MAGPALGPISIWVVGPTEAFRFDHGSRLNSKKVRQMAENLTVHDLDTIDGDASAEQLFAELDQAVTEANKQAISAAAGQISKTDMLRVAIAVSRFRANYLAAVLRLGKLTGTEMPSAADFTELQRKRSVYAEGLEGFGALRHALKRGYISLVDDTAAVPAE